MSDTLRGMLVGQDLVDRRDDARIEAFIAELVEPEPVTARCAFCPDFSFEGSPAEARAAGYLHRLEQHPAGAAVYLHRGRPATRV
jgi:hypothetical protein